jgi:hypothetical protein
VCSLHASGHLFSLLRVRVGVSRQGSVLHQSYIKDGVARKAGFMMESPAPATNIPGRDVDRIRLESGDHCDREQSVAAGILRPVGLSWVPHFFRFTQACRWHTAS